MAPESLAVNELTPSKLIDTVDEFGCQWMALDGLAGDEMAVDDLTPHRLLPRGIDNSRKNSRLRSDKTES